MPNEHIKSVVYSTTEDGPKFLVLAAVHGNEKCGTVAVQRIIREIDDGKIILTKGSVTFVPITNSWAYERDVRFVERNLNRYLVPHEKPNTYEARLGNVLCGLLEDCDVLLDIHSYTVGGPAFASISKNSPREREFAAVLGAESLIGGWEEAYAASATAHSDPNESTGTNGYARRHGALGVTLECGQHKDPRSPEVAYRAIHNGLRYLGMIGESSEKPAVLKKPPYVAVRRVIYRTAEGHFAKPWKNFERVERGELLASYQDGSKIEAPDDGYIVLPKEDVSIGGEWFYFGTVEAT